MVNALIYLLEDDDNIRKLLSYALSKEGYEVLGFSSPGPFWEKLNALIPEMIILDVMLPEEDGLSVLRKLRSRPDTGDLPIMMLTAKDSEYDKVTGLDSGADDYVTKPFGMTELISRVRALLRRTEKKREDGKYSFGGIALDDRKHTVFVCGEEISLSYKEYSLLLELLKAEGNVVTREELLNRVWGEYYDESRTLDVHIRKLRQKLGKESSAVKTVKNVGYRIGGN